MFLRKVCRVWFRVWNLRWYVFGFYVLEYHCCKALGFRISCVDWHFSRAYAGLRGLFEYGSLKLRGLKV